MSIWLDVKYKVKGEDHPTEYEILYGDIRDAFQNFTKSALEKITGKKIDDDIYNTYGFGKRFGDNFANETNPNQNADTVRITDKDLIQLLAKEYYWENPATVIQTKAVDPKGVDHDCLQYITYEDCSFNLNVNQFDDADIELPDDYLDWNFGFDVKPEPDPWGVIPYYTRRLMIVKEFNPDLFEQLSKLDNGQLLFGHPIEDIEWVEYALI